MRFLIDAQLPPALTRHLIAHGHQAEHVSECDLGGAPDSDILAHAMAVGATIISKDEDFAVRAQDLPSEVQVVWIRIGNTTNRALWMALQPRLAEILAALEAGERLLEIT